MNEVVVAYARPDEAAADKVIARLERAGLQARRAVAEDARGARRRGDLPAPRIVLWSRHYAKTLTRPGRLARVAVAARLDSAPLPGRLTAAPVDLRAWRGRADHRGWVKLAQAAQGLAAAAARAVAVTDTAHSDNTPKRPARISAALIGLALATAAAAGGAVIYFQSP